MHAPLPIYLILNIEGIHKLMLRIADGKNWDCDIVDDPAIVSSLVKLISEVLQPNAASGN